MIRVAANSETRYSSATAKAGPFRGSGVDSINSDNQLADRLQERSGTCRRVRFCIASTRNSVGSPPATHRVGLPLRDHRCARTDAAERTHRIRSEAHQLAPSSFSGLSKYFLCCSGLRRTARARRAESEPRRRHFRPLWRGALHLQQSPTLGPDRSTHLRASHGLDDEARAGRIRQDL